MADAVPHDPSTVANFLRDNPGDIIGVFDQAASGFFAAAAPPVLAAGQFIAGGLALIGTVQRGASYALGGQVDSAGLMRYLLQVAFVFGLLQFWNNELPGTGRSLPQLIAGQGAWLIDTLLSTALSDMLARLEGIWTAFTGGTVSGAVWTTLGALFTGGSAVLLYTVLGPAVTATLVLLAVGTLAAGLAQVVWAGVAISICIMLGPILVPWLLWKPTEFLFWGWLKTVITYSLYGAVAVAVIRTFMDAMLVQVEAVVNTADWGSGGAQLMASAVTAFLLAITSLMGMIKVPALAQRAGQRLGRGRQRHRRGRDPGHFRVGRRHGGARAERGRGFGGRLRGGPGVAVRRRPPRHRRQPRGVRRGARRRRGRRGCRPGGRRNGGAPAAPDQAPARRRMSMRNPFQRKRASETEPAPRPGRREQKRAEPAQQFAEIWGEATVAARHLRIGTATLALLCLVLAAGWCSSAGRTLKPIVIRVDEIGRAEAVRYEALEASPTATDPTVQYFLHSFLADHYSRNPATVQERWTRSLTFLSPDTAYPIIERTTPEIALVSRSAVTEISQVENILLRIEPGPEPPYRASADYEIAHYARGEERGREQWTAHLMFTFAPLSQGLIATNPLGLFVVSLETARALDLREAR